MQGCVEAQPTIAPVLISRGVGKSITLSAAEWQERESRHHARVSAHAEGFVQRRSSGTKHPVWDFLFTYYNFTPKKLTTWCPPLWETDKFEPENVANVSWSWPVLRERDFNQIRWILELCENVLSKPPRLGCHGLHEWAMVYQLSAEQVRHTGYNLRLSAEELATLVKSQPLCCTHYDAFRFFTPEARPLNSLTPVLKTRQELEQGGCLHANMDLYKWAYKLWPWIGSDIVADAFEVALVGRELDMRASPYDIADLGFKPICIETEQGRETYRLEQQRLAQLTTPVRKRLRDACLKLLEENEGKRDVFPA